MHLHSLIPKIASVNLFSRYSSVFCAPSLTIIRESWNEQLCCASYTPVCLASFNLFGMRLEIFRRSLCFLVMFLEIVTVRAVLNRFNWIWKKSISLFCLFCRQRCISSTWWNQSSKSLTLSFICIRRPPKTTNQVWAFSKKCTIWLMSGKSLWREWIILIWLTDVGKIE